MKITNTRKLKISIQYIICLGSVLLVASACYLASGVLGYKLVALILLMTVSVTAMLFEILPVLLAALVSSLIWNYFFIPPVFTFHIYNTEDMLMFLLYFIIASVNAVLNFKIRKEELKARDKEEKENAIHLYNTLINSLSHELRTPISTVIGAVDTLKDNKERLSVNDQNELLNQISTAGIRLNRQVENLLNMSRLETGMLKPRKDWFDLNELIYFVVGRIEDERGHNILFASKDNLPLYKTDRGLIEQVLLNLIYNGINHTPENSLIKIMVLAEPNGFSVLVSDNGNGIPEQERDLVFNKFYRASDSKPGGSGLGLSIVKGFIEALGGTVRIEDSIEGGAQFVCYVPAETSYINKLKHE